MVDSRDDAPILQGLSAPAGYEPPFTTFDDGEGGEIRIWNLGELMEFPKPDYLDLRDFSWRMHLGETFNYYIRHPGDRHRLLKEFLHYVRDPKTAHKEGYGEMLTHPVLVSPYAMVVGQVDALNTDRALFYKGDLNYPPFAYWADQYCRGMYGCTINDWVNTEVRLVTLDRSAPALKPCRSCRGTEGRLDPARPPHGAVVRCTNCYRFLSWAPKWLQA